MNYTDAINILTSQNKFRINLGLERIQSVMNFLGNPQDKIKIIHIAGTNGKGSVSSILANILICAGYKTGLYTSPHLVDYTERIKINNNQISKEDFAYYISQIINLNEDLTEFEILSASAFKYFYDNKVDIAVIETGLGGRFDGTNICKTPVLEIITSISKDHTDRLGNTIEEIAFEKAGIIKENSAVICSKDNLGFDVIKNAAKKTNSQLICEFKDIKTEYENGENFAIINGKKYSFSLLGLYQQKNLALVLEAVKYLKINDESLKEGLKTVFWPARFEYIKNKNLVIDGAHNPDGALELKKNLEFYFKNQKRIFIYSSLATKDYKTIANTLFNLNDEIYFYEFNYKNALNLEEYKRNLPDFNVKRFSPEVFKKDCLKIITGSLYMIGDIYSKYPTLRVPK